MSRFHIGIGCIKPRPSPHAGGGQVDLVAKWGAATFQHYMDLYRTKHAADAGERSWEKGR